MKVTSFGISALFLWGLMLSGQPSVAAKGNDPIPEEGRVAAKNSFPEYLKAAKSAPESYGFSGVGEVAEAYLGEPFMHYVIYPEKILTYDPQAPILEMLTPVSIDFPVLVKNKMCALFRVELMDGKWKAVSLGYALMAKKWDSIIKKYPDSKGYERYLTVVPQAPSDFVILRQGGKETLLPISLLGGFEDKEYQPADFMNKLKGMVSRTPSANGSTLSD